MRSDTGQVFRLEDYRPSDYLIPETKLTFCLFPDATTIRAELTIERQANVAAGTPLILDGDDLEFISLALDGTPVSPEAIEVTPDRLVLSKPPAAERFRLTIDTRVSPSTNTALMGLYRSNGVYCTQCEAEGFRRITYFLDRPDILSVYHVRIEASKAEVPILLSNGNPGAAGDLAAGWHFAEWRDPFPKPSYLFALVGGDLGSIKDEFVTLSGRTVGLSIFVEHGKEKRAAYAMDALKRAMRWDEEVFGREYDLDVFNIVAVSDFNMGAMENKGLNVFNDKYVLADEETATDTDYAGIEAVIAHEYFHNWTGNRITCRDWFQLCLKEGLTVFRDHEFSADQRSRPVKRIAEVRTLKAHQFPEDQGPLAHPVRPRRYREINNFYTSTVYEKGSEVVRMIRTLLGAETFRRGMDLYFERHDGQAATIEDFLKVFEDVSGRDLSQFSLWYNQAGTPNLAVKSRYDQKARVLTLEIEQSVSPTPSESRKRLMHIPLAFGLVGPDGKDATYSGVEGAVVKNGLIEVRKRQHTVTFTGVGAHPAVSLNRGFSAPVNLSIERKLSDRLFLARHDGDLFSRWQALNALFTDTLKAAALRRRGNKPAAFDPELIALAGVIAGDTALEPAFRALSLTLPAEGDIAREMGSNIDPDAIFHAREALVAAIAEENASTFLELHEKLIEGNAFSPDAASAGQRALRNVILDYLSAGGDATLAAHRFKAATNMTDKAAALTVLAHRHWGKPETDEALSAFVKRHGSDPLVMDKWYQIQATVPGDASVERVKALMGHSGFSIANPNRVRALIGTFSAANQTGFNRKDGAGYEFFAGLVLDIDSRNPQLAARLATALRSWRSLEPERQKLARAALVIIQAEKKLSVDLRDIVERTLA